MQQLKRKPIAAAIVMALTSPMTHATDTNHAPISAGNTTLDEVEVRARRLEEATVGAKVPTRIHDVPQSLTVIGRAVLEAQGATTLTEALRNVPGITLSAGEGGVIGDNINLRGFPARTDLYLDGMRDRGQYSRETFFLDSIEVLKGPSSMLFGRGSTGGVVNQVSKRAGLRALEEIAISIGADAYYRATAELNRPMSETSAFRVSALAHASESTRDVIESERYGVAPSLRFGIGTPTQVTVSSVHQRRNDIPDYGFPFADGGARENPAKPLDADRDNFYGFTDDRFRQDVDILGLRVEHEFSPTLSLRNQTQYSNARVDAAPTVIRNTGVRERREREIDDQSLYTQADLISQFETGALRHTLVTGVEFGRDEFENQGFDWTGEPNQDLSDPIYGPMPSSAVRSRTTLTNNRSNTLAAYVNETLALGTSWKLVAGVRWDRFDLESTVIDSSTDATTSQLDQTDRMTSVRGGAIYQPSERQSYYVSYGTSFNPSAETLTLSAANQGVDPEENRSLELGARWDLMEGGLSLSTALFRVEKTNARQRDPVSGETTLDGETRVQGLELGANGRLAPDWQLLAGYTFLDGEIVELLNSSGADLSGNTLANTPKHTASLWTTWRVFPAWEVGGGLVYSSDRLVNNENTSQVEGYTRYDATFAYLVKDYELRLNLLNLTDEEYFEVASGGRATPASGRSALATLLYRF